MPIKPPQDMTPAERRRYAIFVNQMAETLTTFRHPSLVRTLVPREWRTLAREEVAAKAQVTLRLDADVLRFYRKLGRGYQAQINGVLRSFMLGRLAEVFGDAPEVETEPLEEQDVFERNLEVAAHDILEAVRRVRMM